MSKDTELTAEYFEDQFAKLLEGVESIVDRKIKPIQENIRELKSDMKVVKAVVTETNKDLKAHTETLADHEERTTILEAA